MMYQSGDSGKPCGTPHVIGKAADVAVPKRVLAVNPLRADCAHRMYAGGARSLRRAGAMSSWRIAFYPVMLCYVMLCNAYSYS